MLAIHDPFTRQMRNRLKTAGIGLGLVRLLQDAGRIEEARRTLHALENGFQSSAEESDRPTCSSASSSTRTEVAEIRPLPSSIA